MDKSIPQSINENLNHALSSWETWGSPLQHKPRVLKNLGGVTRRTYLIEDKDSKTLLTLRLTANHYAQLNIDWERERFILDAIKDIGVAPKLFYMDQYVQIREFLIGRHPVRGEQDESVVTSIAETIRLVHQQKIPDSYPISVRNELNYYYTRVSDSLLKESIENMHEVILDLLTSTDGQLTSKYTLTICHNDLLPENILITPSGVRILDWEYAGLGNPLFDVAVFLEGAQMDDKKLNIFLDTYGCQGSIDVIRNYQLVYKYLELLWWLVKDSKITTYSEILLNSLKYRLNFN